MHFHHHTANVRTVCVEPHTFYQSVNSNFKSSVQAPSAPVGGAKSLSDGAISVDSEFFNTFRWKIYNGSSIVKYRTTS